MNAKATLYLKPEVYRAVKIRAAQLDRTVSDLVNEALERDLARQIFKAPESKAKPHIVYEGPMGLPVLHGHPWPKGWTFNREDLYD